MFGCWYLRQTHKRLKNKQTKQQQKKKQKTGDWVLQVYSQDLYVFIHGIRELQKQQLLYFPYFYKNVQVSEFKQDDIDVFSRSRNQT